MVKSFFCYSRCMKLAPNISSFINKNELLNFKNQGVNFIKVLPVRTATILNVIYLSNIHCLPITTPNIINLI